jgi:hypothetical protein
MRYIQANGSTFSRHIIDNGDPVVFSDNHNVRPSKLTPEEATAFGVHKLKLVTPPPYDPLTQTRIDADAALVDGVWTQVWQVCDLPNEEILQRNTSQAANIRAQRDAKLAETDWIVIKNLELNANIPGVWEVYRQALRDVPTQAGFPWTITWPSQP